MMSHEHMLHVGSGSFCGWSKPVFQPVCRRYINPSEFLLNSQFWTYVQKSDNGNPSLLEYHAHKALGHLLTILDLVFAFCNSTFSKVVRVKVRTIHLFIWSIIWGKIKIQKGYKHTNCQFLYFNFTLRVFWNSAIKYIFHFTDFFFRLILINFFLPHNTSANMFFSLPQVFLSNTPQC